MNSFNFCGNATPLVCLQTENGFIYGKITNKFQNTISVKLSKNLHFEKILSIQTLYNYNYLKTTDIINIEITETQTDISINKESSAQFNDLFSKTGSGNSKNKSFRKIPSFHNLSFNQAVYERITWLENYSNTKIEKCRTHNFDKNNISGNIENFFGAIQTPLGISGPILINGTYAQGYIPLILGTSEGALISSVSRGSFACNLSKGINTRIIDQKMSRAPVFFFKNFESAAYFNIWIKSHFPEIKKHAESESRFTSLTYIKTNQQGKNINVVFYYQTGESSGQNTTTFCTYKACEWIKNEIIKDTRFDFDYYSIESNYSGDKKANFNNFNSVRGISVVSDIDIPHSVIKRVLKVKPEQLLKTWHHAESSLVKMGGIGSSTNFANVIAGIFLSTGQDLASIHESSQGVIKLEDNNNETINVSVHLPSLVIGTIGGGTNLPAQAEILKLMKLNGVGSSYKLAEIISAACLALDISTMAAVVTNELATSHRKFGRKKVNIPDFIDHNLSNTYNLNDLEIKHIRKEASFYNNFWQAEKAYINAFSLNHSGNRSWEYIEHNINIKKETFKNCFQKCFNNLSNEFEKIYHLTFLKNPLGVNSIIDKNHNFFLDISSDNNLQKCLYNKSFFKDNLNIHKLALFKRDYLTESVNFNTAKHIKEIKEGLDKILTFASDLHPPLFSDNFTTHLKNKIKSFENILNRVTSHPHSISFNTFHDSLFKNTCFRGPDTSEISFSSVFYDLVMVSFIRNNNLDAIASEIEMVSHEGLDLKGLNTYEVVKDIVIIDFLFRHLLIRMIKGDLKSNPFSLKYKEILMSK